MREEDYSMYYNWKTSPTEEMGVMLNVRELFIWKTLMCSTNGYPKGDNNFQRILVVQNSIFELIIT